MAGFEGETPEGRVLTVGVFESEVTFGDEGVEGFCGIDGRHAQFVDEILGDNRLAIGAGEDLSWCEFHSLRIKGQ